MNGQQELEFQSCPPLERSPGAFGYEWKTDIKFTIAIPIPIPSP